MKKLLVTLLTSAMAISFIGCGSSTQTEPTQPEVTVQEEQIVEEEPTVEENEIEQEETVEEQGEAKVETQETEEIDRQTLVTTISSDVCKDRVRNVNDYGDLISVEADFSDNFTNDFINMSACDDTFEIAKQVFTDESFKDVNEVRCCFYAPTIDKFGNEGESIAIKIFITRDTFSQFNLDSEYASVLYQSLPETADYYQTDFK